MYILSETQGQTCNKFFQYLYYLKLCISLKERLRIQLPDLTIEDFPNLLNNPYISFPFYSPLISKIIGRMNSLELTRRLTVLFLNNYCRFILHQLSFHRLCFVSGKPTWGGTDEDYSSIRPILQHLFELRKDLREHVDSYFCNPNIVTCGIHMRGGDYRKWLNGKYFYEQTVYRQAADRLSILLPNSKIRFLICSNEPIDNKVFEGIDYFSIDGATASQDIYALSQCNYMIGTLSSFNAWASLIGQVPLYTVLRSDEVSSLKLSDFSPVVNYNRKENGWKFPRNGDFYQRLAHPWLYRHSNKEYLIKLNFDL